MNCLAPFVLIAAVTSALAALVSFEREVMPLLEKRCNKCH